MTERKYKVLMDGYLIAENMNLENAIILLKGVFEARPEETRMQVSIEIMGGSVDEDEIWERRY